MLAGIDMMSCPNLAVPAEVMQHIVRVESSHNPYAIGVVGSRLVRQPQNLDEAVATAEMLETKGYNFSLGLAQVNRYNLSRYGIASYEKAFERCANLETGSRILADCYRSAGGDWGKSFSCYYSGNFVTGYTHGYVQKIYASMSSERPASGAPVQLAAEQKNSNRKQPQVMTPTDAAAYRIAIRSSLLDPGNSAAMDAGNTPATPTANVPLQTPINSTPPSSIAGDSDLFVPIVRGPNDPIVPASPMAAGTVTSPAAPPTGVPGAQQHGSSDAAFVF
jgi:type IV secretion system protein VirB1